MSRFSPQPRLELVTCISMVSLKSFLKQPSEIPGPWRGCTTPQRCLCQPLPPVSRRSCEGVQQADCLPLPPPPPRLQRSAVTSRAKNSRRCCGRITWLAVMRTDPAAGVSRAWPAEGRIGLKSKKTASRQHPKGSGPGLGHREDRPACRSWAAQVSFGWRPALALLRAPAQGGSGRASIDTPASVCSFQGGNCAALSHLPRLGTLTAPAAQGTSALCRLPVWHRPSPSVIPLLRGWTNPWHLDKGENTGREEITAEETFLSPAE